MKIIKICLSDEEYVRLMQKANYIKADCESNYKGYLKPAKEMLALCAKLNLEKNMEMFAEGVNKK